MREGGAGQATFASPHYIARTLSHPWSLTVVRLVCYIDAMQPTSDAPRIPWHEAIRIAAEACCDPRSVRAYYAGTLRSDNVRARIEKALAVVTRGAA